MNLCLFSEGTGQGVAGKITNVTRLRDLCIDDARQKLIARHFAAWLDKLGVAVAYLGLWDTVDATVGLDVAADCSRNVKRAARMDRSRGEARWGAFDRVRRVLPRIQLHFACKGL